MWLIMYISTAVKMKNAVMCINCSDSRLKPSAAGHSHVSCAELTHTVYKVVFMCIMCILFVNSFVL